MHDARIWRPIGASVTGPMQSGRASPNCGARFHISDGDRAVTSPAVPAGRPDCRRPGIPRDPRKIDEGSSWKSGHRLHQTCASRAPARHETNIRTGAVAPQGAPHPSDVISGVTSSDVTSAPREIGRSCRASQPQGSITCRPVHGSDGEMVLKVVDQADSRVRKLDTGQSICVSGSWSVISMARCHLCQTYRRRQLTWCRQCHHVTPSISRVACVTHRYTVIQYQPCQMCRTPLGHLNQLCHLCHLCHRCVIYVICQPQSAADTAEPARWDSHAAAAVCRYHRAPRISAAARQPR